MQREKEEMNNKINHEDLAKAGQSKFGIKPAQHGPIWPGKCKRD